MNIFDKRSIRKSISCMLLLLGIRAKFKGYQLEFNDTHTVILDLKDQEMLRIGGTRFNNQRFEQTSSEASGLTLHTKYTSSGYPNTVITGEIVFSQLTFNLTLTMKNPALDMFTNEQTHEINKAWYIESIPLGVAKFNNTILSGGTFIRPEGGIPYEMREIRCYSVRNENYILWEEHPGTYYDWGDHQNRQIDWTYDPDTDSYKMLMRFSVTDYSIPDVIGVLMAAGKRSTALIRTAKRGNILKPTDDLTVLISFYYLIGIDPDPIVSTFDMSCYDYDGSVIFKRSIKMLPTIEPIEFSFTLPQRERELFFVEASCRYPYPAFQPEIFKTTIAILPEHEYIGKIEDSTFGMAAWSHWPTYDEPFELMKRMGVRWLRAESSKNVSKWGMKAYTLKAFGLDQYTTKEARKEFIKEYLDYSLENGNDYFELGNEFDYGVDVDSFFDQYNLYLDALKELQEENSEYRKINVSIFGTAGYNKEYLQRLYDEGYWNHFQSVAMHVYRNDDYADGRFRDQLKEAREQISSYGAKPIFLSEAYGLVIANRNVSESYRGSADNLIISYVMGIIEEIGPIYWYRLDDGTNYDPNGVKFPIDPSIWEPFEFHFGLTFRDHTPKPAFMAYCAAAEHLDGAKYLGNVSESIEGDFTHGYKFDTPRGPLTIIWDRTDSYWMQIPHKDPWIDIFQEHRPITFETKYDYVRVADAIGRERIIKAEKGKVNITVSGSPIFVTECNEVDYETLESATSPEEENRNTGSSSLQVGDYCAIVLGIALFATLCVLVIIIVKTKKLQVSPDVDV